MTHYINPHLTERQKNIIKGTILGGSSIVRPKSGKNCYLSMRSKNVKWLAFKSGELSILASDNPLTIEKTTRWHSLCYPVFADMRIMFYEKDERRLKLECLDSLRDIALAVWFGDSAYFKRGRVVFNTHIWGDKGTEIIKNYFELLGYNSTIIKERDKLRLELDEASGTSLVKLVSPHLPVWYGIPIH